MRYVVATVTSRGAMGATVNAAANPQLDWIKNSLRVVEPRLRRLRRADTLAIIVGTVASTGATAVAGITAVLNRPAVTGSWGSTCALAALLSLAAAVSTGLHKGLGVSTNLSKASACAGKLRALDLAATLRGATGADLTRDCEAILAEYPEFLT
jgi:hypothetical protein